MLAEVRRTQATCTAGASPLPDMEEWLRLARTQIDSADRVAAAHRPDNGMCACSRPLPCVQLDSLMRRRTEFERAMAALVGPTVALPVIEVAMVSASGRRRSWWR